MKDYLLPIDYINKNKDVPLTANNFNDGDLLLFAALPLIDISNVELPKENEKKSITLKELIDNQIKLHNNEKYGLVLSRNLNRFLEACKDAKRYENLKFYNQYFKLNNKTQSSYFMCDISKNITVVDFSGTDDSVTGWVENLKLLVEQEQECLVNAKDYVNRNCKDENKYYIFGRDGGKQLAQDLQVPLLGQIPLVQSIREAGDDGMPIAMQDGHPAAKMFDEIVDSLIDND